MLASARWELVWTSVGLKAVMAVSGAVLSGWMLLHMGGNLLVFGGAELIDHYAAVLESGPLLWIERAAFALALIAHAGAAAIVTWRSKSARVERYRRRPEPRAATWSGRSMRFGGAALLVFVGYHLLHIYGPLHASYEPGHVYHNVVAGLADPFAGSLYLVATLLLGLHLHHGTASLFRSLGHARLFAGGIRRGSLAFTVVVTAGLAAPCVAALAGWL